MARQNDSERWTMGPGGIVWRKGRAFPALLAASAGLLVGIMAGRWPDAFRQEARNGARGDITSDYQHEREEDTLDGLLSRTDSCIRQLRAELECAQREARQKRIAYALMREQGFGDNSPECRRLVTQAKSLEEEVERVERDLAGLRELRASLIDLRDRRGGIAESRELLADVRRQIQTYIGVKRPLREASAVIPDEQWKGGQDGYMKIDGDGATRGETGHE